MTHLLLLLKIYQTDLLLLSILLLWSMVGGDWLHCVSGAMDLLLLSGNFECDPFCSLFTSLILLFACVGTLILLFASCHAQNDLHFGSFLPIEPTNTAFNDAFFGLNACFGIHPLSSNDFYFGFFSVLTKSNKIIHLCFN